MKLLDKVVSAFWHGAGYAAARSGDYERALVRFDRADSKDQPTLLRSGYRAIAMMLLGRKEEAQAAFRELAIANESTNPNDEYARCYARMYVAYLDDDLVEADRLAALLKEIKCRQSVKNLLLPLERPSLLAANSQLSGLGVGETDPLGFREEGSGVHWMKATEAFANGRLVEAMDYVLSAEAIGSASPAQRALKAGLLIHLQRPDEARALYQEVVAELGGASTLDERYLRLYCDHHSSSDNARRVRLLKKAKALESDTALRHFLPLEGFDAEAVKLHFQAMRNAYRTATTRISIST